MFDYVVKFHDILFVYVPAMMKAVCLTLQVVLYEDELADNGVSLLTVKVVNANF